MALPTLADKSRCPMIKIEAQRLPDMTMPRGSHAIFVVNGELTVIGGHTTNFVPTATAEYFRNGRWHRLNTAYAHDNGFALPLSSGRVLVGGGHSEPLGIGQTFTTEWYDPVTHTCEGFGCLDRKRALATAVELADGRVVITGNHYQPDGFELFDGQHNFADAGAVTAERLVPHVLQTAPDNVVVVSPLDTRFRHFDTLIVDRLHGDALRVPIFNRWRPILTDTPFDAGSGFIGDKTEGDYSHLLAVTDTCGALRLMLVRDTTFTLLPTAQPIPQKSKRGPITWIAPLVADREAGRAYVVGYDSDCRVYVLSADYRQRPAPLTLYYTDPLPAALSVPPVLMPNGDLVLAGGIDEFHGDNFKPYATVWRLCVGRQTASSHHWLCWTLCALLIAIIIGIMVWKHRRLPHPTDQDDPEVLPAKEKEDLFTALQQLMVTEKLFLNPNLKLSDAAKRLHVSRRTLTARISEQAGCSFTQYVNQHRVEHAKRLLAEPPEKKLAQIATESGFGNESTFFRAFKITTGMTPKEWAATPFTESE